MASNRRGRLEVSKDVYESTEIDKALFGLEIKVYEIEYKPFTEVYVIHFTSPYAAEVDEGVSVPVYLFKVSPGGYELVPMSSLAVSDKETTEDDKYCRCSIKIGVNNTTGNCVMCGKKYARSKSTVDEAIEDAREELDGLFDKYPTPEIYTAPIKRFERVKQELSDRCMYEDYGLNTPAGIACTCPKCSIRS